MIRFRIMLVSVKVHCMYLCVSRQNKVEKAGKLKCDLFLSPYLLTSLIPKRPNMHSGTQKQGHKSFLPLSFPMVSEQWTFRGQKGQNIYQKAWCIMALPRNTFSYMRLLREKFLFDKYSNFFTKQLFSYVFRKRAQKMANVIDYSC